MRTASFRPAIEIFSIRKTLISDNFDKLVFQLNKNFNDVNFSHADKLTGCPLDANNITKVRAYRGLICCYPHRTSRETWVRMTMAFSSSMKIFLSYVPGIHVVVFTRSSSVGRVLASTPICCSMLQNANRTKPSADTSAINSWVRVVTSFLCPSLFQRVCVRVCGVFLVAT